MDYTSILNMHQELSLIAVFLLVFVLDLFLPEKHRYLIRRISCILLGIQLVSCSVACTTLPRWHR